MCRRTGLALVALERDSVTRARYAVIFSARVLNVSVSTTPSASLCPLIEVLRIVSSPYAQRPMRHHRVSRPDAVRVWISTSIQLPLGVSAAHDGINCENGNRVGCHDDVQLPVMPPPRTMPSAGGCANPTLLKSADANAGDVSSIGAGTRELMRPAGIVPSVLRTVTCQYTPASSIHVAPSTSGRM